MSAFKSNVLGWDVGILPDDASRSVDALSSHSVGLSSVERESSELLLHCLGEVGVVNDTVERDLGGKHLVEITMMVSTIRG